MPSFRNLQQYLILLSPPQVLPSHPVTAVGSKNEGNSETIF